MAFVRPAWSIPVMSSRLVRLLIATPIATLLVVASSSIWSLPSVAEASQAAPSPVEVNVEVAVRDDMRMWGDGDESVAQGHLGRFGGQTFF